LTREEFAETLMESHVFWIVSITLSIVASLYVGVGWVCGLFTAFSIIGLIGALMLTLKVYLYNSGRFSDPNDAYKFLEVIKKIYQAHSPLKLFLTDLHYVAVTTILAANQAIFLSLLWIGLFMLALHLDKFAKQEKII